MGILDLFLCLASYLERKCLGVQVDMFNPFKFIYGEWLSRKSLPNPCKDGTREDLNRVSHCLFDTIKLVTLKIVKKTKKSPNGM